MTRNLSFIFLFVSAFIYSQNAYYTDSLTKSLKTEKSPFKKSVALIALCDEWRERDLSVSNKYFNELALESKKITRQEEVADFIIKRSFLLSNRNEISRIRTELDSVKNYVLQSRNDLLLGKYWAAYANLIRLDNKGIPDANQIVIDLLKKSILLLSKTGNYEETAKSYFILVGFLYNEMPGNKELTTLIDEFSKVTDKITSPRLKAKYFSQVGFLHSNATNKSSEALNAYLAALKNYLLTHDSLNIGATKITLGSKTMNAGYKADGEKEIFAGIRMCERNSWLNQKKTDQAVSSAYSKLAGFYATENLKDKSLEAYRTAIYYNNKAENYYNEPLLLGNMGLAYLKFDMIDSSLIIQKKALELRKKFKNREGELFSYGTLAEICFKKGEYDSAIAYAKRSLDLANQIKRHLYDDNAFQSLYRSYEKIKDYEKSIYYLNRLHTWRDSVAALRKNKEIDKILAGQKEELARAEFDRKHALDQLELTRKKFLLDQNQKELLLLEQENDIKAYSLEKAKTSLFQNKLQSEFHQKEIDFLNTEKKLKAVEAQKKEAAIKQQRTVIYSISIGGIVVLALLFVAVRGYRQKQKDNKLIEQQKKEVEQQKHLVDEKNKEILDSITYAKRLQEAILPPPHFVNSFVPANFILYKPKDIVAGDFYWAENITTPQGNNLFLIAAADSTGHGVPGAMVSVVCSNALNRSVKEFALSEPGKILDKTRELVLETFAKSNSEVKDGMDISLLSIEFSSAGTSRKIKWSGANNPLWYIDNGIFKEIKANKQPIGKTDNPVAFTTHEIDCAANTTFYLFTDGFADQFGGPKGKKFKYKQLEDILTQTVSLDIAAQKKLLDQKFEEWKGTLEQVDDVCIIRVSV